MPPSELPEPGRTLPPPSPTFLIMNLGRRLRDEVEGALAARGLALRHLSALGHLSREPGLSYSELGRRAGITAQSMQATLRHLESLGAVERRTEAGRGRTAKLHVTAIGAALCSDGQRVISHLDERLLTDIPVEHHSALLQALTAAFARRVTGTPGSNDPAR